MPGVLTYSTPVPVNGPTVVKTRAFDGSECSGLTRTVFITERPELVISEVMYHPRPAEGAEITAGYGANSFEFIEIKNVGSKTHSLLGVRLVDGVEFDFTEGAVKNLAAGRCAVVVKNLAAFKLRYPGWAGMNIAGEYNADKRSLSDGGEEVALVDATGGDLLRFSYSDEWYPNTDAVGFSLTVVNPHAGTSTWGVKSAWRSSAAVDGSPGSDDAWALPLPGSVVINEALTHQDVDDPGDWIELRNTTAAGINIGGWYLSDNLGNLKKYRIPDGTVIPANGHLVCNEYGHFGTNAMGPGGFALSELGDEVYLSSVPAGGYVFVIPVDEVAFRSVYTNIPGGVTMYGPYSGSLDNDGERLALSRPGEPEIVTGYVPYIIEDNVRYNDAPPWPTSPDGGGKMLKRLVLANYGNDPANWIAANPPAYGASTSFTETVIQNGSEWKYLDDGSDQGTAWREPGFDDGGWASGPAQLGYGEGDESKVVSYGPDPNHKYITTYFRRTFSITNASSHLSCRIKLLRDDGAVVYLNGTELLRDNMPEGTVDSATFAPIAWGGEGESVYYEFDVDVSALVEGGNVLAVEVHQSDLSSSDLSFDLQLECSGVIFRGSRGSNDVDDDGLPDAWELEYFGSTNAPEGGLMEDKDHDGLSNYAEYVAGTDPTNRASRLALGLQMVNGKLVITCPMIPASAGIYEDLNRFYTIQQSSNLVDWMGTPGVENLPAENGTLQHTNVLTGPGFYRARSELQ